MNRTIRTLCFAAAVCIPANYANAKTVSLKCQLEKVGEIVFNLIEDQSRATFTQMGKSFTKKAMFTPDKVLISLMNDNVMELSYQISRVDLTIQRVAIVRDGSPPIIKHGKCEIYQPSKRAF